jgi:small basic protein
MSNFVYFISGFFLGAAVADFLWAYKMGIPQVVWARIKAFKVRIFNRAK